MLQTRRKPWCVFSQPPYLPVLTVLVVILSMWDILIFEVHEGSVCVLSPLDPFLANPCDLTNNFACLTDFVFWGLFEPCQPLPLATSGVSVFARITVSSHS